MTRLRRITIDWDFKNPLKVCFYIYKCLKYLTHSKGEQIIIKQSHSKGFHIFLWTRKAGNKFKIKDMLGNDILQSILDKKHIHGRQTLFGRKRKINVGDYIIQKGVNN